MGQLLYKVAAFGGVCCYPVAVQRIIDKLCLSELLADLFAFSPLAKIKVCLRMLLIIPKKNGYSVKYVENRLRAALEDFWNCRPRMNFSYNDAVIVFHHMYARSRNPWEYCVPADSEVDCVIRLIFVYVLHQMFQISFRHYHCCSIGEEERTEVYVIPISDFDKWLAQETPYLAMTPNRGKLYDCPADARKANTSRG